MTPILFATSETAFTTQGKGRLSDCISCVVTEELNGIYELELQYPITGRLYNEMVQNGGIVYCTHDDAKDRQAFDIYKYSAPINGIVTFYAHHISYRLSKIVVKPFSATSCADAVSKIVANSMQTNPFELANPMSAKALLGGVEGSLLDVYGKGEYKFDNFNVSLLLNRGTVTDVVIRYGKNLTELTKEHDETNIYNAVVPFWKSAEGEVVYYNGTVVATGQTVKWAVPLDLSSEFSEKPTTAQLQQKAEEYLANNTPWIPDENITFSFFPLWQSEEYKHFTSFERVKLGDTITVVYTALGVTNNSAKVVKVVYNVLSERYDSIEVGKLQSTLAETILAPTANTLANVKEQFNEYVPSSGGTFTGDVSFEGLADEIDRRCSAAIPASSVGWKRILTYSSISANMAIGSNPFTVDITLFEHARQIRSIRLNGTYTNIFFDNEQSVTQDSSYNAIDGIRYTYDGNNHGHIDVHYALSSARRCTAYFDVKCRGLEYRGDFVPVDFTAVADNPAGETIYATYSFTDNGFAFNAPVLFGGAVSGQGLANLLFGIGNVIAKNTDCNSIVTEGKYTCPTGTVGGTLSNAPYSSEFGMLVLRVAEATRLVQIAMPNGTAITMKLRYYNGSTWTAWKTITPT